MPTPKQVRFHYKRMMRRWRLLQNALNDAHTAEVISYPDNTYRENAPYKTHWDTRERIIEWTEKELAHAMRDEIMKELKE